MVEGDGEELAGNVGEWDVWGDLGGICVGPELG